MQKASADVFCRRRSGGARAADRAEQCGALSVHEFPFYYYKESQLDSRGNRMPASTRRLSLRFKERLSGLTSRAGCRRPREPPEQVHYLSVYRSTTNIEFSESLVNSSDSRRCSQYYLGHPRTPDACRMLPCFAGGEGGQTAFGAVLTWRMFLLILNLPSQLPSQPGCDQHIDRSPRQLPAVRQLPFPKRSSVTRL